MKDYYYILGLDKNATTDDIKKAYRKLSIKFHPDKNEGDKFFEERFKEINEAYEILSDEIKKRAYDSEWNGGRNNNNSFETANEEEVKNDNNQSPLKTRKKKTKKHWYWIGVFLFFVVIIICYGLYRDSLYPKSENELTSLLCDKFWRISDVDVQEIYYGDNLIPKPSRSVLSSVNSDNKEQTYIRFKEALLKQKDYDSYMSYALKNKSKSGRYWYYKQSFNQDLSDYIYSTTYLSFNRENGYYTYKYDFEPTNYRVSNNDYVPSKVKIISVTDIIEEISSTKLIIRKDGIIIKDGNKIRFVYKIIYSNYDPLNTVHYKEERLSDPAIDDVPYEPESTDAIDTNNLPTINNYQNSISQTEDNSGSGDVIESNNNSYNSNPSSNQSVQPEKRKCSRCNGTGKCLTCNKVFRTYYWGGKNSGWKYGNETRPGQIMCSDCSGAGGKYKRDNYPNLDNYVIGDRCGVCNGRGWRYCPDCNSGGGGSYIGQCRECRGAGYRN